MSAYSARKLRIGSTPAARRTGHHAATPSTAGSYGRLTLHGCPSEHESKTMTRQFSVLVSCFLGAAVCLASVSAAGAQAQRTDPMPALQSATVAWACSHFGPGGGCTPGAEGPPTYDPVRLYCPTITADMLVGMSFNLSTSAQIKNEPAWMIRDVYQVQVVAAPAATHDQMTGFLRDVVVKAFGLRYHIEDIPAPVYKLMIAKGGPKFRRADKAADQTREEIMAGNYEFGSVQELVTWLNRYYYLGSTLRHPVEDDTGLTGTYDIRLKLGAGAFPSRAALLGLVKQELGLETTVAPGHKKYVAIDGIKYLRGKWTLP